VRSHTRRPVARKEGSRNMSSRGCRPPRRSTGKASRRGGDRYYARRSRPSRDDRELGGRSGREFS
jgi:hypothetical protein